MTMSWKLSSGGGPCRREDFSPEGFDKRLDIYFRVSDIGSDLRVLVELRGFEPLADTVF